MRLLAYNTKTKPRIQMLCGVGLEHAEFDLGLRGLGVGQQLADQHLAEAAALANRRELDLNQMPRQAIAADLD